MQLKIQRKLLVGWLQIALLNAIRYSETFFGEVARINLEITSNLLKYCC